jgi:hypothetical protein
VSDGVGVDTADTDANKCGWGCFTYAGGRMVLYKSLDVFGKKELLNRNSESTSIDNPAQGPFPG